MPFCNTGGSYVEAYILSLRTPVYLALIAATGGCSRAIRYSS